MSMRLAMKKSLEESQRAQQATSRQSALNDLKKKRQTRTQPTSKASSSTQPPQPANNDSDSNSELSDVDESQFKQEQSRPTRVATKRKVHPSSDESFHESSEGYQNPTSPSEEEASNFSGSGDEFVQESKPKTLNLPTRNRPAEKKAKTTAIASSSTDLKSIAQRDNFPYISDECENNDCYKISPFSSNSSQGIFSKANVRNHGKNAHGLQGEALETFIETARERVYAYLEDHTDIQVNSRKATASTEYSYDNKKTWVKSLNYKQIGICQEKGCQVAFHRSDDGSLNTPDARKHLASNAHKIKSKSKQDVFLKEMEENLDTFHRIETGTGLKNFKMSEFDIKNPSVWKKHSQYPKFGITNEAFIQLNDNEGYFRRPLLEQKAKALYGNDHSKIEECLWKARVELAIFKKRHITPPQQFVEGDPKTAKHHEDYFQFDICKSAHCKPVDLHRRDNLEFGNFIAMLHLTRGVHQLSRPKAQKMIDNENASININEFMQKHFPQSSRHSSPLSSMHDDGITHDSEMIMDDAPSPASSTHSDHSIARQNLASLTQAAEIILRTPEEITEGQRQKIISDIIPDKNIDWENKMIWIYQSSLSNDKKELFDRLFETLSADIGKDVKLHLINNNLETIEQEGLEPIAKDLLEDEKKAFIQHVHNLHP